MSADLRYPIGPFKSPLPFPAQERAVYLSQVAEAPAKLRAAVVHLSDAQLDTPYRAGGWTVRQVVHHLPDGHLNWYLRAKFALTGSEPSLPFDENVGPSYPMADPARLSPHWCSSKVSTHEPFYCSNRSHQRIGPESSPVPKS
jgi:hypothetical protein